MITTENITRHELIGLETSIVDGKSIAKRSYERMGVKA